MTSFKVLFFHLVFKDAECFGTCRVATHELFVMGCFARFGVCGRQKYLPVFGGVWRLLWIRRGGYAEPEPGLSWVFLVATG